VYAFPAPRGNGTQTLLRDWTASGVLTVQSGTALTIGYTNATNAFGISEDRAQLAGNCNGSNLVRHGSTETKVDGYFNASCFTLPPIIGADGVGTGFGNSSTGIVSGPGQSNLDLALMRNISLHFPREGSNLQLRAEFFNSLNHPQFSNPNATYGSPGFGLISSTSVNPRIGQVAAKLVF